MKDGKIAAKGTLDDIIAADPDMYGEYNLAVKLVSESEAELSGNESETVREERHRLQQQVKKVVLAKQPSNGKSDRRMEYLVGHVFLVIRIKGNKASWLVIPLNFLANSPFGSASSEIFIFLR